MSSSQDRTIRRLLVVDPCAATRTALRSMLALDPAAGARVEFEIDEAEDIESAYRHLADAARADAPYAVAFVPLDPAAPGRDAEIVDLLWEEDENLRIAGYAQHAPEAWARIDVRFDRDDRLMLVRTPFDPTDLRQVAVALSERWHLNREARLLVDELERSVAQRTLELQIANGKLQREVSERRLAEDRLRHHAMHDTLTGLANRELLLSRLNHCIARREREPDFRFAVLFLDMDNFKVINDSLGHEVGDELLVAVTRRLQTGLRAIDTIVLQEDHLAARFGGDEFAIVLEGLKELNDVDVVCERLLGQLTIPFELSTYEVVVTASIGVTLGEGHYTRAEELLRDADLAMYRAKAAGKARFTLFDRAMHETAIARLQLENDLRHAIEKDQFRLVYQPIVALGTGSVYGFEALLRWDHPERGTVSPGDFVPIAEETGLIVPIGWWVLEEACRQLRLWDATGVTEGVLSMNVNLSRRQLLEAGLFDEVRRCLSEHGLAGERLNLEITESAVIENAEVAAGRLHQVRRLGVGVNMDDFGTGYSSLSCLHRFPLDVVKIDREFMATMGENRDYAAVVHGIITIAHNLGMQVTAEGVETQEQLAQILALDCDYVQGYLFAKPLDADAAETFVRSEKGWRLSA